MSIKDFIFQSQCNVLKGYKVLSIIENRFSMIAFILINLFLTLIIFLSIRAFEYQGIENSFYSQKVEKLMKNMIFDIVNENNNTLLHKKILALAEKERVARAKYQKGGYFEQHLLSSVVLILGIFFNFFILYWFKENKKIESKLREFNTQLRIRVDKEVKYSQEKERQLLDQSRLAQMGELISMIAHQWRQPLGAISAISIDLNMKLELDSFDLEEPEKRKECQMYFNNSLKDIDNLVQALTITIDDFRNFYKPNKKFDYMLIEEVLRKSLNIIQTSMESDGITFSIHQKSTKKIKILSNELMQVFLNILKNAQDNFKERSIQNPKISISCADNSEGVIVKISDNGGGIDKDILAKIFEPYFSTKNEKNGTGLGLYMSKIMIEEHHDGSLHVSNEDDGVCFAISLKD